MNPIAASAEFLHRRLVRSRRVAVLAGELARRLPEGARLLDVGCGDGTIARAILAQRPDIAITGIDVMVRPHAAFEIREFDGSRIPFEDGAFDVVSFVDVLHHTDDPEVLLREARRVARSAVLIKDHLQDGLLARPTLRFMDWIGNHYEGVVLPYNYWPEARWRAAWRRTGLQVEDWSDRLGLYGAPATWLFDRRLHFVARLVLAAGETPGTGRAADTDESAPAS